MFYYLRSPSISYIGIFVWGPSCELLWCTCAKFLWRGRKERCLLFMGLRWKHRERAFFRGKRWRGIFGTRYLCRTDILPGGNLHLALAVYKMQIFGTPRVALASKSLRFCWELMKILHHCRGRYTLGNWSKKTNYRAPVWWFQTVRIWKTHTAHWPSFLVLWVWPQNWETGTFSVRFTLSPNFTTLLIPLSWSSCKAPIRFWKVSWYSPWPIFGCFSRFTDLRRFRWFSSLCNIL